MKNPTLQEQQQLLNLYNQGLFVEAVASSNAIIARFPDCVFAWKVLGAGLQSLQRTTEALAVKRKVVELMPNDADAHSNLGLTLKEHGLFDEAEKSCRRSLKLNPKSAAAYCNLGNVFQEQENFSEAEKCYKHALKIDSTSAEFHNNLGAVLKKQDKNKEAEASYRKALAINPNFPDALGNLAQLLFSEKRYLEADSVYQHSLRYVKNQPDFNEFIYTHLNLCCWNEMKENLKKLAAYFEASNFYTCNPFAILSFANFNALDSKKASCLFADKKYKNQLEKTPLTTKITNSPQKIRIGYLSADFHSHATVHLMAGILENRNTENFDVYLYSYGVEVKDDSRSRVEKACDVFRNIRELSDDEAAQQILADEIDILVDLKGNTQGARLGIQALRPAPIVVSWLGYHATLGHERLADYIIGDATVTPLEHAEHFSETLALMPHCYQPNDNTRPIGACPTRAEAGLPENGFVFATFNQSYKISPEMFDIWCRLLIAVPNSVLWILEPIEVAQENLRREMTARGVEPSRLIFAPKLEQTEHLGRLQRVDLAVDTFPCCSHTTASDALWAGVPLVTKMGETFASRVAASILRTMDLAELVTTNDDDYFNVALDLAQNPEKLASIKQKITAQKQISPLFDTQKFARDLERLYQTIWAQELKGERKAVVLESEENMNENKTELRKAFQACPLCESTSINAIIHADTKNHSLYNDALPSDLTWLLCTNCQHIFSQHYWTEDGLKLVFANAHANQVVGGNPDQKRQTWKPVVQNVLTVLGGFSVLQSMPVPPMWIDVGCGDGGLVMTAAEFGFHAVGLDARAQTVQALRESGYQAACGDFMTIAVEGNPLIISMMDVLEHLPNPCEALQRAHSLLDEKGVLVISLPNSDCSSWRLMGNANPYWIEIEHYHNFNRQRLMALLNQYGFDVVHYDIPFRYKAQMELYAIKKSFR